ncbi:MAG: hypothetical protein KAR47_01900 [Planctomycetes bacterium]|nr:hypothetical protein [Planctomycetota bacterium]
MFRSLLWKEWQENCWKLCFCTIASAAFTGMLFRMRIWPDLANCLTISFIQMFAVPVIFAMDIFSGEMSNRTIYLLFKVPARRWMIFFSKYLIAITGILLTFAVTGGLMELMSHGREEELFSLLRISLGTCTAALLLFTWFTVFGCQSTSEAGSLVAIFSVIIGWGILYLASGIHGVRWAQYFVTYRVIEQIAKQNLSPEDFPAMPLDHAKMAVVQILTSIAVLAVACYRYVKIRRYL